MSQSKQAQFIAVVEELPRMLLWIRTHLTHAKMDQRAAHQIELAAEEAILNVIHHAYLDKGGAIELTWRERPEGIELAILDHGPPFDPLTVPRPDRSSPLEERKEGGLGVFLIRSSVDEIRYQREGETNVLTLIKRFSQKR